MKSVKPRLNQPYDVAPLVGAWIEIGGLSPVAGIKLSLLSWERGLKLSAAHAGHMAGSVAPLVGAWIEIVALFTKLPGFWSLLSWERGLKFYCVFTHFALPPSLLSWERGLKF